jgi:hypothetical protein
MHCSEPPRPVSPLSDLHIDSAAAVSIYISLSAVDSGDQDTIAHLA